jgi:hypothetical protein
MWHYHHKQPINVAHMAVVPTVLVWAEHHQQASPPLTLFTDSATVHVFSGRDITICFNLTDDAFCTVFMKMNRGHRPSAECVQSSTNLLWDTCHSQLPAGLESIREEGVCHTTDFHLFRPLKQHLSRRYF